jgi:hypothetical protein
VCAFACACACACALTFAAGVAYAATPASTLTGFLSQPTDQVAVPGALASGEITPEGDLYSGFAEYELHFGRHLLTWDQPTRTLPNPSLPLLSSTLFDGGVKYTLTVFAVTVATQVVAYYTVTASNTATVPRVAKLEMSVAYTRGPQVHAIYGGTTSIYRYERPLASTAVGFYDQLGQTFSPLFQYSIVGRDLDRSNLLLARGPTSGVALNATAAAASLTAPYDSQLFTTLLGAHAQRSYTWQIPLDAVAPSAAIDSALDALPLASALTQLRSTWNAQETGMMQLSVSEAKVDATYKASITEILSSRYEDAAGLWVQGVNKLQYQAFWIRDAALMTQALDLAGLHTQAAQNLTFMDTFQQPSGLFISRADQYDGWGQALWALTQHAELTQDSAYAAAQLPAITAAINWLESETTTDSLGLMPAGNPNDDELISGHITGDNLWAAVGLRSAVADAVLAGRPDLASTWQADDQRFEDALDNALKTDVAANGHITPALDVAGGQDWGNYNAAYPMQILPATSPAVRATLAYAQTQMVQGLPTYDDGHSLHDYLGFPLFQTELVSGDVEAAVAGLYAELVHTTSTDNGWEDGVTPSVRASATDISPHGTFSADYVALLRNMLVADTPDGGVDLLSGASPAWLQTDQHISVTNAPTDDGTISFIERSSSSGETLIWNSNFPANTPLRWTLPAWAVDAHVLGGAALTSLVVSLSAPSGKLAITFSGHAPAQSYALTLSALNSSYRSLRQAAPLTLATQ